MCIFEYTTSDVSKDVEMQSVVARLCKKSELSNTVFCMSYILENPLSSPVDLMGRQRDVRKLDGADYTIDRESERDFMWLMEYDVDEELKELLETPFFDSIMTSWMNKIWFFIGINNLYGMVVSPLVAVITPLLYLLSPIFIMRFRYGVKVGLMTYLKLIYQSFRLGGEMITLASGKTVSVASMLLSVAATGFVYVQSVLNSVKHARNLYVACEKISSKVKGASRYVKQASEAITKYGWSLDCTKRWLRDSDKKTDGFVRDVSGLRGSLSESNFAPWNPSFGKFLTCFRSLDRDSMIGFARHVSVFDAVNCVSSSVGDTVFVKYQGPGFLARGLRHPLVDNCVGNDVSLAPGTPSIVLTGANASGKSTVLRSVALASVMSQTLTVAYCDAIAVKPVAAVYSHMCVPDDVIEGKSRFQAEMSKIGDIVTNAESGKPCILVVDELFSSTTAAQSVVCLDSVLKRLSGFHKCMFILATHHKVDYPGVRRLKMDTSPESWKHRYKMVEGVNDVFNAVPTF